MLDKSIVNNFTEVKPGTLVQVVPRAHTSYSKWASRRRISRRFGPAMDALYYKVTNLDYIMEILNKDNRNLIYQQGLLGYDSVLPVIHETTQTGIYLGWLWFIHANMSNNRQAYAAVLLENSVYLADVTGVDCLKPLTGEEE